MAISGVKCDRPIATDIETEDVKPAEVSQPAEVVEPESSYTPAADAPVNLDGSPVADSSLPVGELEKGDQGAEVTQLQESLVELGYLEGRHIAYGSGNFGGYTAEAVAAAQQAHGLPPTGIYDEATRAALMQDEALYSDPARLVEQDYQALLGREPTSTELAIATSQMLSMREQGATLPELRSALDASIASTSEYQASHPPGTGQPPPGYDERLAATSQLEGQFDNPFAVANQLLGFNAADVEASGLLSQEMPDGVPDDRDCASFVTSSLIEAGWVPKDSYSDSVRGMISNLSNDPNFVSTTDLSQLQPGDPIVIYSSSAPNGHAVMYAGQDSAGNYLYVGSNNVNNDGTQKVTYNVLDPSKVLNGFHYTQDRGNPNGTADGAVTTCGGLPTGTLAVGAQGVDVLQLQQSLADQGYLDPSALNGSWGVYEDATAAAVRSYQLAHGIEPATGVFDVLTMSSLVTPPPAPQPTPQPFTPRTPTC